MKNRRKIKIVSIIVVAVVIATVFVIVYMSRTSNKVLDDSKIVTYTVAETLDETSEYGISYIDVPENMMDGTRFYFCRNDKLVHFNARFLDEDGAQDNSVTVYDIQEGAFELTHLDFSSITLNELTMKSAAPYMDDEYVLLMYDSSIKTDGQYYQFYIVILDENFNIDRYGEITYDLSISQIAADKDGYIAICGEAGDNDNYPARIYDRDFNLVLTENSPTSSIYYMVGSIDSKLAFMYVSDNYYLGLYNSENNSIEYSLIPKTGYSCFVEYGTNVIIYDDGDGSIYTYGIGDNYITKIIDLTQYGIEKRLLWQVVASDGDTFFCPIYGTDDITGETVLTQWAVISKDAAGDDRQQLTYAVTGSYPTKAVSDLNSESTDYFIKVVDYSDEDGLERLEKEIVSGNIPDILDCSDIDVEAYVEKGVLSEVSDVAEDVGILDVLESAMEVDGGLYDLPYSYNIGYISGRTSLLPNTTEYTADEIREIIEENDITYLAESMLGYDFVLGMIRGNEDYYLTSGAGAFVEDEFVSILSLIKDYGFSNSSIEAATEQIVNLSFEEGDYLFSYGLVVGSGTVSEIYENASEYFATGVTLGGVTDPSLLMTVTFGMTTSCQSEEAFNEFAELVYGEELTELPLTDAQLEYTEENMEDVSEELYAFIEKAAKGGAQRNYCGYSSIIEDEIERMIDQNIDPSKIASEIQEKMSIYINEQGE